MFKPLLTRILAHLMAQNQWARPVLMPFDGQSVKFNLMPASATLVILEDGGLAMAGESNQVDATVTLTPSTALRLLANDASANSMIKIEGNTALATELAKVLQHFTWDVEEDLSHLIGDAPANEVAKFGKKTLAHSRSKITNLAEMMTEYWQEEQPIIAKKRHVEQFIKEVDQLREDTDRLEKRLEKLSIKYLS
jgi:ubiquinone biosynthesis protein UbiJ